MLTYELRNSDKSYSDFFIFLEKGLGVDSYHALRDSWWIDGNHLKMDEIRLKIKEYLHPGDIFFITKLDADSINGWMPSNAWDWLIDHLKNS